MPETMWMVRAGEGGYLIEEFARGYVAIGWNELGDLTSVTTQDAIRDLYEQVFPDHSISRTSNAVAMIYKFRSVFEINGKVVTYDSDGREYLIGKIESDYYFSPGEIENYNHLRKVKWLGKVSRETWQPSSLSITKTLMLKAKY